MIEQLTIRPGQKSDVAALDALFARTYPKLLKADYPPSVLVTALPLICRAQPQLVTCGTFFVAEAETDGAIVGAGGWTPGRQDGIADIRHVVTDDRHVRQGIGRRLFDTIFATARAAGVRMTDCKSTRTAVPFYQAVGFAALGPIEVDLRPGITFPAVHMQRAL